MGARAFTYGSHIYLGEGEHADDVALMAHEVTHVIQQQASPAVRLFSPTSNDPLEREAQSTATQVAGGGSATVSGRTGEPQVQGWSLSGWIADKVWDLLEEVASKVRLASLPEATPVIEPANGSIDPQAVPVA